LFRPAREEMENSAAVAIIRSRYVGGTRYQLPSLLVAFLHLLLVLDEQGCALHVGVLEHLPAAEQRDVCDWLLPGPLKDKTPSERVPSRA